MKLSNLVELTYDITLGPRRKAVSTEFNIIKWEHACLYILDIVNTQPSCTVFCGNAKAPQPGFWFIISVNALRKMLVNLFLTLTKHQIGTQSEFIQPENKMHALALIQFDHYVAPHSIVISITTINDSNLLKSLL